MRAKRFLESMAIKARQILEFSGWLDNLKREDIVAVKNHMGEAYNVGYLRPVIISTLVDLLKEKGSSLLPKIGRDSTLVSQDPATGRGSKDPIRGAVIARDLFRFRFYSFRFRFPGI